MDERAVIEATRSWVFEVVIGLNLCPFARRPFAADLIRYAVTCATTEAALLEVLEAELAALVAVPRTTVETTLLIHPHALADFLDYNDFLATADALLSDLDLEGVIQIASFHPEYQFAGTKPDAVENYTNRSPYPMLHLLREESVSEVNGDPEAIAGIPERNIETLRGLGRARILELLERVKKRKQL
ncbi:DUF1415 domain-containing protein [Frigoriglobus tundricola]|uniref:DUF1415 domain-containing protein n=1 Tax=Frigoriglobus tundricola TaxID=2774151 RepID=UPI00148EA73A|nr:DUF1415 domain-containing protein [Frigoriglobus tundricola]